MTSQSTEVVGLDKHDPAGMAAWLRERGENTRTFLALTSDQQRLQFLERWQQNVLPHLAFRFEQAAQMVEKLVHERDEWAGMAGIFDAERGCFRAALREIASYVGQLDYSAEQMRDVAATALKAADLADDATGEPSAKA